MTDSKTGSAGKHLTERAVQQIFPGQIKAGALLFVYNCRPEKALRFNQKSPSISTVDAALLMGTDASAVHESSI